MHPLVWKIRTNNSNIVDFHYSYVSDEIILFLPTFLVTRFVNFSDHKNKRQTNEPQKNSHTYVFFLPQLYATKCISTNILFCLLS